MGDLDSQGLCGAMVEEIEPSVRLGVGVGVGGWGCPWRRARARVCVEGLGSQQEARGLGVAAAGKGCAAVGAVLWQRVARLGAVRRQQVRARCPLTPAAPTPSPARPRRPHLVRPPGFVTTRSSAGAAPRPTWRRPTWPRWAGRRATARAARAACCTASWRRCRCAARGWGWGGAAPASLRSCGLGAAAWAAAPLVVWDSAVARGCCGNAPVAARGVLWSPPAGPLGRGLPGSRPTAAPAALRARRPRPRCSSLRPPARSSGAARATPCGTRG